MVDCFVCVGIGVMCFDCEVYYYDVVFFDDVD